jgi:hypothetical protein
MTFAYRLFCYAVVAIFLAWIFKLHFLPGGDFLFRAGSVGAAVSLLMQLLFITKDTVIQTGRVRTIFVINTICLLVVYIGLMLKVAHVMDTQFEKDFVLDFIGIPAIVVAFLYTFSNFSALLETDKIFSVVFLKHIVLPWLLFIFSFLLYAVYSVILSLQKF